MTDPTLPGQDPTDTATRTSPHRPARSRGDHRPETWQALAGSTTAAGQSTALPSTTRSGRRDRQNTPIPAPTRPPYATPSPPARTAIGTAPES